METKSIPGFSKYVMSEQGVIRNAKSNKIVMLAKGKVRLFNDEGKRVSILVQDLHEITWAGAKKQGKEPLSTKVKKGDTVSFTPFRSNKELTGKVLRIYESYHKKGLIFCVIKTERQIYEKKLDAVKLF